MAESDDYAKSRYLELEARHNREVSHGEVAERASRAHRPGDNRAFYLIEREAIQLRRLRWDPAADRKLVSERVDDLASSLSGIWDRKVASRSERPPEYWLAQYARPLAHAEGPSPPFVHRLRTWFGRTRKR